MVQMAMVNVLARQTSGSAAVGDGCLPETYRLGPPNREVGSWMGHLSIVSEAVDWSVVAGLCPAAADVVPDGL